MNDVQRPRGRPRPQETIDRDKAVLDYLRTHGPQSRNALADALGLERVKTWLSLDRLRREGRVRTCARTNGSGTVWSAEVDSPCP